VVKRGKVFIGTSGWHYKHWKGTFYPERTKDAEQMQLYLQHFRTVEINNSFYRLPSPGTFETWRDAVPRDFVFSVKASRFITHNKKLKDPASSSRLFFDHVVFLKRKLGPILFQLPPLWKVNTRRLEEYFQWLPKGLRYTFEFRNPTWYTDEVFALLKKYRIAFCMYDLAHHTSPLVVTGRFVYIRLHGPGKIKYQGSYSKVQLKTWAQRIEVWRSRGLDVYVYFDNDQLGYAAFNALELKRMVEGAPG
jgi:uncharacterized protein YecE (DUF72 family)